VVVNKNSTSLSVYSDVADTVSQYTDSTIGLTYISDFNASNIKGALCAVELNSVNSSMLEVNGQYSKKITFSVLGANTINLYCSKTGFNTATIGKTVKVIMPHCGNSVQDWGETGVDCGGECSPCNTNCQQEGQTCTNNGDCCNNICSNGVCQAPTCSDHIQNQGEAGIDCGGPCTTQCSGCANNNDCSQDGASYCSTGGVCVIANCTTDADCQVLSWWDSSKQTYMQKPTKCDTDGLCRFITGYNATVADTYPDIYPLSGLTSNVSGKILYVGNCNDKTNGFRLKTKVPTKISYSFAAETLSPALAPYAFFTSANDSLTTTSKNILINELCAANIMGYGGFPGTSERLYANINIMSCAADGRCSNNPVDVLMFKHNLKNALSITLTSTQNIYNINATNRSIMFWVKSDETGQYTNISTIYKTLLTYNDSAYRVNNRWMASFHYLINTTDGETYAGSYGSALWMPIEYDEKTQWFKVNFELHAWMIYLTLGLIIVGIAYMGYRRKGGS